MAGKRKRKGRAVYAKKEVTPEEVERRKLAIQRGWTPEVEIRRRVIKPVPWVPQIADDRIDEAASEYFMDVGEWPVE